MNLPRVFLTSNVFIEIADDFRVSHGVREEIKAAMRDLQAVAEVSIYEGRFPSPEEMKKQVTDPATRFIGCHLSHPIAAEWLRDSNVVAVCTATMGYDHVGLVPGVLVTHTPGVLNDTVADFTIAIVLSALRNTIGLHEQVWGGEWKAGEKWDLDQSLSRSLDGQVVGLVGLGEIGAEVARRMQPWGVEILYHDIERKAAIEGELGLQFEQDLAALFERSDVVSVHMPLNEKTRGSINKDLIGRMKDGALLVNTARGGVLNTGDLLDLLESGKHVNLAFDVHETEPLDASTLARFKRAKEENPRLRIVFAPHNASADADTRGKMATMLIQDLAWLARSEGAADLAKCRLIPPQAPDVKNPAKLAGYRISTYWEEAKK